MASKISERLLNSAQDLFWRFGIRKTTVEEIAGNAGTSKMSFYRNFENKDDIAKQVLTRFMGSAFKEYTAIMSQDIPFNKKMVKLMSLEYEESQKMSNEFIREILTNENQELHIHFEELAEKYNSAFVRDLFIAQQDGHIRKDIKISFLVRMLAIMTEQMGSDSFASMYSSPQEAIQELSNFFLYGIFPPMEEQL